MDSQIKPQAPYVVRGRVELRVPTTNGEHTYIYPTVGSNTYQEVGKQIRSQGLAVPHGDYTASLIHAAYCSAIKDEPEFSNVRNIARIARNNWLWVFVQDYWTDKGLYGVQDEKALGRSKPLTIGELEEMLKFGKELSWGGIRFSADNKVRFAPKGSYTFGEYAPESLTKDGAMIVQYGVRGAELCGKVSATLPNKPKTCGLDIAEDRAPEIRVSTLDENDCGLHFGGDSFDNGLPFSLSMGCGTWGRNSFSDNLNYRHFMNITRIVRTVAPREPALDDIFGAYRKKHKI